MQCFHSRPGKNLKLEREPHFLKLLGEGIVEKQENKKQIANNCKYNHIKY